MDPHEIDEGMKKFEGPFLESADLMSRPPCALKISDVHPPGTMKSADGRVIDKPVIAFEGARKMLILNKTNVRILKALFGFRASGWVGHPVTIGVRYLAKAFGQTNVPTLRILPPEGAAIPFSVAKHMGSEKPLRVREDSDEPPRRDD
jgi:hypothetical protein